MKSRILRYYSIKKGRFFFFLLVAYDSETNDKLLHFLGGFFLKNLFLHHYLRQECGMS